MSQTIRHRATLHLVVNNDAEDDIADKMPSGAMGVLLVAALFIVIPWLLWMVL